MNTSDTKIAVVLVRIWLTYQTHRKRRKRGLFVHGKLRLLERFIIG